MKSMYHDDVHPTTSGKKMWSNFCTLVDAAVILSEEESLQRIFCLFPRKTRSSVMKRRYPQQILNRASTSSTLIDLNEFPIEYETEDPQNQLPWLSSSCVTAADSETKTLRNPSSELLLLDYKTAESEKTEMIKDSLNPNSPCSDDLSLCLVPGSTSRKRRAVKERKRTGGYKKAKVAPLSPTARDMPEWLVKAMRDMNGARDAKLIFENTSRKRRAVKERKRTGGYKKAKVAPLSPTARDMPEWLVKAMRDMNGARDAKLIFEKTLFVTDVNPTQNRLSMPYNNLHRNDFLTPVESRIIDEDINHNKKIGVGAILVDQWSRKWGVMLKRWEMKKDSGKGSWNYNLICGWNDIIEANGLKEGDNISLWSFRCCGILCFAMEQSSSSLALCLC
ncbi:PREDICTED: B3 domain-containing protein At5g24050-like [Camelina sativa]|uniref:B3 domain-containing protein At5g24050-like n=1 Tax=Camelina sativa TaxID=90675 RepID=A0ABM1QZW0_CAMSA|nr:PREDICTED: B3 domain-containing protein At5g24050-like [Camelina sativa]